MNSCRSIEFVRVRAAVDHVQHRHRQRRGASRRRGSGRARRPSSAAAAFAAASETPRIAFAPSRPLFGVPSRSISARSRPAWSAGVAPARRARRARRSRSRPPATRPCRPTRRRRRAARPPRARRSTRPTARSRGRRRPTSSAHVDLDGRVAARVEHLPPAHARRSSLMPVLLCSVVVGVLLVERELVQSLPSRPRERLGGLDPRAEALRRRAQLELGIDVQLARHVHGREEHVAELGRDARIGSVSGAGSASGSSRAARAARPRGRRARRRGPGTRSRPPSRAAAPCARRAARAAPPGRRGRRPRGPPARASARSQRSPHAPGGLGLGVAEDVRVARDELRVDRRAAASRLPAPRSSSSSARKYDWKSRSPISSSSFASSPASAASATS